MLKGKVKEKFLLTLPQALNPQVFEILKIKIYTLIISKAKYRQLKKSLNSLKLIINEFGMSTSLGF